MKLKKSKANNEDKGGKEFTPKKKSSFERTNTIHVDSRAYSKDIKKGLYNLKIFVHKN
jgi:hypothetical protein